MEAFQLFTPLDPEAVESMAAIIMAFVNQSAPEIKKKLQKLERLGERLVQELVRAAEKVFYSRETPEEQEDRLRVEAREREDKIREEDKRLRQLEQKRQLKQMTKIMLTTVGKDQEQQQDRNSQTRTEV